MSRFSLIRLAVAVVAVASQIACGPVDYTGDFVVAPGSIGEAGVFQAGEQVWLTTSSLAISPGSDVTLLSIEPLGLPADAIREILVSSAVGEIGLFPEHAVPDDVINALSPLDGHVIPPGDDEAQVIVVIDVPPEGVSVHGYRLRYSRDGTIRTVYLPDTDHVCTSGQPEECTFVDARR